ncbi:sugar lactone lactonase YvrE [Evansella vedderi]|uniref:Regucalcin n=1 Tax=Evansella vedderi TaxID=38282 RepID=A0ABT9ZTP5_9BACI|nr:SMP-30/gluconolactonase/LRE family protein [Evansella vedderi]MDQ0254628.1 sugar lactone lactonase YvrE [Evansella vedderi]
MKPELILDAKATLGEGPCWDEMEQKLYWVDIMERKIHVLDPETGENETIVLDQYVGCAVLKEGGGLLLGLQNGFYELEIPSKKLTLIHNPEKDKPENRFNDGKVDPLGRFWAGTMHLEAKGNNGALYRLDSNYGVKKIIGDVGISNGLAWDVSRGAMYFIDTTTKKVAAFDYDLKSGEISNKHFVITIPEGEGFPDGMTIDVNGHLWIAHWDGAKITRWDPSTGKKIEEIKFPVDRITSCCFGGKEMNELFVTTARNGLSPSQLEKQPLAGGLFKVKTAVKGSPTYRFK